MVIEITTGNGFKGTLSYVKKEKELNLKPEQKPEIIDSANIFGNTKEMSQQMRFIANGNSRVSKPVMHITINFNKSENISLEQEIKAVEAVFSEIGISKDAHQYLLVKHHDALHPHYHIVLNKVDLDGNKLNLGFDGKREEYIKNRLQVIADKIEQKHGLNRTAGRNIIYDPSNENGYRFLTVDEKAARKQRIKLSQTDKNPTIKDFKNRVQKEVNQILEDKNTVNVNQFKSAIEKSGINIRFMENKNGISGISFNDGKNSIKGSQIDAKWRDIDRCLTSNAIYAKEKELRSYIDQNSHNSSLSISIVDEAIREKMNEINPKSNVWETWRKNPSNEKLYNQLIQYAELVLKESLNKAIDDTATRGFKR